MIYYKFSHSLPERRICTASQSPRSAAMRKPIIPRSGKPKRRSPLSVCMMMEEPMMMAAIMMLNETLFVEASISCIRGSKPL